MVGLGANSLRAIILLLLALGPSHAAITSPSLVFEPATLNTPTEITFTFTTSTQLLYTDPNPLRLDMPGFTSGNRGNTVGSNILDQTIAKRVPNALWNVYWYEGTVANAFADSFFKITPVQGTAGAAPGSTHIITIDKSLGIKQNCGTTASQVFQVTDEALNTVTIPASDRTQIGGGCYFTGTRLDVVQPLDKTWMQIIIQFTPAFAVAAGENVTVNMAGFTNHNFTGIDKADDWTGAGYGGQNWNIPLEPVPLEHFETFYAYWREGEYVQHHAGFTNSSLRLQVRPGYSLVPGTSYKITLDRVKNKIGTMCSLKEDFEKITISSNAAEGVVNEHPIEHTDAVGSGCSDLNHCSGHGTCNYCSEQCICEKAYGGPGAIVENDIRRDCSERVCPSGYAWGWLPESGNMGHSLKECSAAGSCDRTKGVCRCYEGFAGAKCERRTCPIISSEICAGHGTCLSIRQLSSMPSALPLSDPWGYASNGRHFPIYGGGREGIIVTSEGNVTWDEDFMHRCHCDSSWSVGLGSGETQVPEYFGDACQLRHCPSGDDPMTTVDETDCSGKAAPMGKGVGQSGNKCFVECSNRGVCDYELGQCMCFKGFWGSACEILKDVPGSGEEEEE